MQITHSTMGLYPYHLPDSWDAALSSAVPSRDSSEEVDYSRKVFFVKGAKKSGKSTFARTLLNRLTTKYETSLYSPARNSFCLSDTVMWHSWNVIWVSLSSPPEGWLLSTLFLSHYLVRFQASFFLANRLLILNRTTVHASERSISGSFHRLNDTFLFAITLPVRH